MLKYRIDDKKQYKRLRSELVNYNFNKVNGNMQVWGKTKEEDMVLSPFGPFIADIEVTTKCNGVRGPVKSKCAKISGTSGPCKFCYKGNTSNGVNMSFEIFKALFDKLPEVLTQIAFGADATLEYNPDLWKMMEYSRENGVIPNITCANISDEVADKLVSLCGAVAISDYGEFNGINYGYDSVKKLTDRGMTQCNMHKMISTQSLDSTLKLLDDIKTDPRLAKLNAVVFLSLKRKGRGKTFTNLTQEQFNTIVDKALSLEINFGFDSCSAEMFAAYCREKGIWDKYASYIQSCESSLESSYFDVNGKYYPCSFTEGEQGWEEGLEVIESEDFLKDVWFHVKTETFRKKLLSNLGCGNCRKCPLFSIRNQLKGEM